MKTQSVTAPVIRTFQPENFPDWDQVKKNPVHRKDDRENMGVDDKLIGDDLELEQAQAGEAGTEAGENENVY